MTTTKKLRKGSKLDLSHIAQPLRGLALPVRSLVMDPANARTHDRRNIDAIKSSLQAFGQRKPIVVRKNGMVVEAGNGTVAAAKELAETDARWGLIAAVVAEDDQITAASFAIADNRSAELAKWDDDALGRLLQSIEESGSTKAIDLGFDDAELANLIADIEGDNGSDDVVPEAPEKTITKKGDIWQLGDHRVLCGDSTSAKDFERLLAGQKADLCVTSPPYNVGLCYPCTDDKMPRDDYLQFIADVASAVYQVLKPGRFLAWNLGVSASTYVHHQVVRLEDVGFQFYRQIIWQKTGIRWPSFPSTMKKRRARHYSPNFTHEVIEILRKPSRGNPAKITEQCPVCKGEGEVKQHEMHCANAHETLFLLTKGQAEEGGENHPLKRYANDVWRINQSMATRDLKTVSTRRAKFKTGEYRHRVKEHPATFPVEVPRAVMTFLTARGESVIEPFCGTGTTIVAAQRIGRRCFGMEISPKYCDIAVRRWEKLTGEKAKRVRK